MSGWFDGVVGHARVISLLTTELEEPANAYLFVGAAGVGKATVARHFATGLLCPTREPGCNVCRRVMEGITPTSSPSCRKERQPRRRPGDGGGASGDGAGRRREGRSSSSRRRG